MVEGLPTPDQKDLELLRSSQRRNYSRLVARSVFTILGALLGVLLTVHVVRRNEPEELRLVDARQTLAQSGVEWGGDVVGEIASYQEWLSLHGTALEVGLFADSASLLAHSMVATAGEDTAVAEMGIFKQAYISMHTGLLRALFLVIASLRAWLVVIGAAVVFGLRSFRPYDGDDVLGQMGNGRLFYSGVRAGLDVLTADGAPDVQVRGLACPQFSSQLEARNSQIWKVLGEYGAQNGTNEALTAILAKNGDLAAYVCAPEEDGSMAKVFAGATLGEHAADLVAACLELQALYAAGQLTNAVEEAPESPASAQFSSHEYALAVRSAMSRVLSIDEREEVGRLSVAEVATAVLALLCGKVLAHSFEGGRWVLRSQFPHLSARAVLHSVLAYPTDYNFQQRTRIRQALVYASRSSAFAPVRMPTGMSSDAWALRQWMEVMLANPHQLPAVADEVELVGIVRAAHEKWSVEFLETASGLEASGAQECVATTAGLLFVPLKQVLEILQRAVSSVQVRRIEALLARVSNRQRAHAAELAKREGEVPEHISFDRIFPPLREAEVVALSALHGFSAGEVRDWSALRIVLTSYGWLARRVGDYTVPESSLIFAVFKSREPLPGANSFGLVGKSGYVPFRGAKLESRMGPSWNSRFAYADRATMAETKEDFDKLMAGIEEKLEEEPSGTPSPASA